jgi:hypothetical protein
MAAIIGDAQGGRQAINDTPQHGVHEVADMCWQRWILQLSE